MKIHIELSLNNLTNKLKKLKQKSILRGPAMHALFNTVYYCFAGLLLTLIVTVLLYSVAISLIYPWIFIFTIPIYLYIGFYLTFKSEENSNYWS